jgi:hypothetical protein
MDESLPIEESLPTRMSHQYLFQLLITIVNLYTESLDSLRFCDIIDTDIATCVSLTRNLKEYHQYFETHADRATYGNEIDSATRLIEKMETYKNTIITYNQNSTETLWAIVNKIS